jgi:hypothetical protein
MDLCNSLASDRATRRSSAYFLHVYSAISLLLSISSQSAVNLSRELEGPADRSQHGCLAEARRFLSSASLTSMKAFLASLPFLIFSKRSSDSIVFLRERLACSHDDHVAMRKWTAFGFGRRSSPGQRGTQVPGRLSMTLAYTN